MKWTRWIYRVFVARSDRRVMSSRAARPAEVIFLAVLALVVRGGVLLAMRDSLVADPDAYFRLAGNLVAHGTLGQGDVPSAYRPPLYPLLLAPAAACGAGARAVIAGLHLALGVATVLLTYRLGRCWGLGNWAALAAALVACAPILLAQSTLVMTETLATLLAVTSLLALSAAAEKPASGPPAAAGASIALASLCRPTFLVFLAASALVLPAMADRWSDRWKAFLAFVAAAALVLSPWVVRNQIHFGRPIAGTTHGGYTLLLGNNPWFYGYLRDGAWGTVWDAEAFKADWSACLARGDARSELANDRLAYAEARKAIRHEPGMFFYACVVRVRWLWAPLPHQVDAEESLFRRWLRYAAGGWYVLEFALAAVGLAAVLRSQRLTAAGEDEIDLMARAETGSDWQRTWLWGLLLILSFTAVHAFYWTNMRMRAPLEPAVALAAAGGVAWIAARVARRKQLP